ncbi:MAG TPA: LuxR C-terminal-related transcriptional regulator, partial [Planctomycetaceae bacterium]|nr:LuxR C-terminal-related transcriptional regulator [Planctomycetaceae bacterium]
LAAIPDLIFILSRDGVFLSCCGGRHGFDDLNPESLVGANLRESVSPETYGALLQVLAHVLEKGEAQILEFQMHLANRPHHVEAHLIAYEAESIVAILRDVTERTAATDLLNRLTPRERQVLSAVVAGKPNKLIAQELDISIKTVELHRARVMQKLDARSSVDLVRLALASEWQD